MVADRLPIFAAEIYDPAARTFSPTGGGPVTRIEPDLVLLPNGEVFATGGECTLPMPREDGLFGALPSPQ